MFFLGVNVQCPDPGTIIHGIRDPPNGIFFCGDQVTYVCDIGYELRGDSVAQCTETGEFTWKPPECVIPGKLCLHCIMVSKKFEFGCFTSLCIGEVRICAFVAMTEQEIMASCILQTNLRLAR